MSELTGSEKTTGTPQLVWRVLAFVGVLVAVLAVAVAVPLAMLSDLSEWIVLVGLLVLVGVIVIAGTRGLSRQKLVLVAVGGGLLVMAVGAIVGVSLFAANGDTFSQFMQAVGCLPVAIDPYAGACQQSPGW